MAFMSVKLYRLYAQYRIAYGPGNCGQHGPPSDPNQHFVRECYGTTFGTTLAFDCQTV